MTSNKRTRFGRVCLSDDPGHGKVVSPYDEDFWSNIEDGIKPAVEALYHRNYLTISSCQGHRWFLKPYVDVAFYNEESAEEFRRALKFLEPDITTVIKPATEFNNGSDGNNPKLFHTQTINGLNIIFNRSYDNYIIVRVSVELNLGGFACWKYLRNVTYRRAHLVATLADAIQHLPFYEM